MAEHITEAEVQALRGKDMDTMMKMMITKINEMANQVFIANNQAITAEQGLEDLRRQQQRLQQDAQVARGQENGRDNQREQTQFTRSLSSLPKFTGLTPWREWEQSFLNWIYANMLTDRNDQKRHASGF